MQLMHTFTDVGAATAGWATTGKATSNGRVGWHSHNNLSDWAWPSDECLLIGYERWYYARRKEPKVLEAFYATHNPSIQVPPLPPPDGHWHIVWSHRGHRIWRQWIDSPLVEDENLYLKKGRTGPKGNLHTKDKGQGKSKGM